MKIGIITCWQSLDNYGQQLQCYALQSLLRSWGHDVYLIRYAPEGAKPSFFSKVRSYILHPQYVLLHLPFETKVKRNNNIERQIIATNKANNPIRKFESFRKDNLEMTSRIYKSADELIANPPQADIYITGSDQVWHDPYFDKDALGWFLQFGDDKARRLSYAASIGRLVPDGEKPLLRKFLSRFDAISVREESARLQCVEQGFDAKVCLDPTMLLHADNYKRMAKAVATADKFAFLYVLNVRSSDEFYWSEIKEYLDKKGISFKSVTGTGYYPARELIENNKNILATIPEWLGFIENAECIFTTSFHGTVFSILMHRPFLTIGLKGKYGKANSRMEQLLQHLGIPERILDPNKSIQEQMESPIDWDEIDDRIESIKKSSLEFLKENLK